VVVVKSGCRTYGWWWIVADLDLYHIGRTLCTRVSQHYDSGPDFVGARLQPKQVGDDSYILGGKSLEAGSGPERITSI